MDKRILLATVIVGSLMVIGVAVYEGFNFFNWANGDDPFVTFIYRFQTLIAGICALIAAFSTVNVMKRSDEGQHNRHRELLKFNLRREVLIVKRASEPQIRECAIIAKSLREVVSTLIACDDVELPEYFRQEYKNISQFIVNIQEMLTRQQVTDAIELMNPDGLLYLQEAQEGCKDSLILCEEIGRHINSVSGLSILQATSLSEKFILQIESLDRSIIKFRDGLINLEYIFAE